jgi:cell wall-associated NlpC family hydrolase
MPRLTLSLLIAATLALSAPGTALSSETSNNESFANNSLSFFERYTNAAQDVILEGLKLVGVRYRMGGNNIETGLDCSSFVQMVFKESIGTYLPRTAREQSQLGERVDASELKPGDLVFFNTMRRTFSHVGIYLGDNYFMHAPRAGAEVRVESMKNSYWMTRFNGARRIIEAQ